MRYGPAGVTFSVMASAPAVEATNARKSLAASMFLLVLGTKNARGIQTVAPFFEASLPGCAKNPMSFTLSGQFVSIVGITWVSIGYWAIVPSASIFKP